MSPEMYRRFANPHIAQLTELALIGGIHRTALEGSKERIELEALPKARLLFKSGKVIPTGDAHSPISDRVSLDNTRLHPDLLRAAKD